MEDKNKRLEEFFQNSMEQFNDVPSNNVWEGLSDKLDQNITWQQSLWARLKYILPLVLLFGFMGGYTCFTHHKLQKANLKLAILQADNLSLEAENKLCGKNSVSLQNQESLSTKTVPISTVIPNSAIEKTKSITAIEQKITDTSLVKSLRKTIAVLQEKIQSQKTVLAALNKTTINNKLNTNNSFLRKELLTNISNEQGNIEGDNAQNSIIKEKDLTTNDIVKKEIRKLKLLELDQAISVSQNTLSANSKPISFPLDKHTISNRYRFGINTRLFTTITENPYHFNLGNSFGITQEYRLNKHWSITNNIQFNHQKYRVRSETGTLSNAVLKNFPGYLNDSDNVVSIETESRYFDTNLGIKYCLISNWKNQKLSINPSIVWQLYLPQNFEFNLQQSRNTVFTKNIYYAYLGSANISLVYEKRLGNKSNLQLSLWGEKSFIPLGEDNQYITMFGLSGGIIFGK